MYKTNLIELRKWCESLSREWIKIFFGENVKEVDDILLMSVIKKTELIVSVPGEGGIGITDIEPVKLLKNLKKIVLNETSFSNLASLSELINLEEIECEQTSQSDLLDLTPLKKLHNLKRVSFFKAGVKNINALSGKPSLKFACFCNSGTSYEEVKSFELENPHCKICQEYKWRNI